MKIGILTQPLHNNYGGILQAYALQKVLKDMGHEVLTVDLHSGETFYRKTRLLAGRIYRKYLLKQKNISIFHNQPNIKKFIEDNISLTKHIPSVEKINRLKKYNFDAYVVGSDQVWRPDYSPDIPTFFLDFIESEKNIKRLAYAASFGIEDWMFSPGLTAKCAKLVQKFDAVSVREESGVYLCENYLKVSAQHMPDPTLLLKKDDYIKLIEKDHIPAKEKTIMVYILDQTDETKEIIKKVKHYCNLTINTVMPEKVFSKENRLNIEQWIYPPVTQWLRGFFDAEFVLTDSFHGTIFAILFNKPFITIGNKKRGLTRFYSLLNLFNLADRLILPEDEIIIEEKLEPINYQKVEDILSKEKEKAFVFLSNSLNS